MWDALLLVANEENTGLPSQIAQSNLTAPSQISQSNLTAPSQELWTGLLACFKGYGCTRVARKSQVIILHLISTHLTSLVYLTSHHHTSPHITLYFSCTSSFALSTPSYSALSIHPLNTPHTPPHPLPYRIVHSGGMRKSIVRLLLKPINAPLVHPINPSSECPLSTHPMNLPYHP